MAKVRVTDPYSGATVLVPEDSPQAKAWGGAAPRKEPEPKRVEKPRRGRPPKK